MTPGNVNAEARGNMMALGFEPERFDAQPVERTLRAVGERLRERLADVAGPVTFPVFAVQLTRS